jgi:dTDP-4-amino-4,6-dideoxygalactose transaminase
MDCRSPDPAWIFTTISAVRERGYIHFGTGIFAFPLQTIPIHGAMADVMKSITPRLPDRPQSWLSSPLWQEITPVFCDIDPKTHNIDPGCVEKMITPRTTGILGVHIWGRACPVAELTAIARRHKLRLLFDAAHALGCSYEGRKIGSFGAAEVFSFHATKFLNSFEGGAVATNDDDLANKIRLMTNFGFAGYDRVIYLGTNGKMSEASAAMGLCGLESLNDFIVVNYRNYVRYRQELDEMPGLKLIRYSEHEASNYQYIIAEVDEGACHITRDQLMSILEAENVLARRYFYPGCHRMEPYRSLFPHAGLLLPETERMTRRVLCLPTGTSISEDDIAKICSIIRVAVANGAEAARRLQQRDEPSPAAASQ